MTDDLDDQFHDDEFVVAQQSRAVTAEAAWQEHYDRAEKFKAALQKIRAIYGDQWGLKEEIAGKIAREVLEEDNGQ